MWDDGVKMARSGLSNYVYYLIDTVFFKVRSYLKCDVLSRSNIKHQATGDLTLQELSNKAYSLIQ